VPIADAEMEKKKIFDRMGLGKDPIEDAPFIDFINKAFAKLSAEDKKKEIFMVKSFLDQYESEVEMNRFASLRGYPSFDVQTLMPGFRSSDIFDETVINASNYKLMTFSEMEEKINLMIRKYEKLAVGTAFIMAGAVVMVFGTPLMVFPGAFFVAYGAHKIKGELNSLAKINETVFTVPAVTIVEKLNNPFKSGQQNTSTSGTLSDGILLLKDSAEIRNVMFQFAGISSQLRDYAKGTSIQRIFHTYDNLIGIYTKLYNGKKRLEEFLGFSYQIPNPDKLLLSKSSIEERAVKSEDFAIENVSVQGITLTKKNDANAISLMATSTSVKDKVDFTFDVVFKQRIFGTESRKTIKAVFDGRTNPYKVAVHAGNKQDGEFNKKLKDKLQVKVTDKAGKPVEGAVVEWKANGNSGSLSSVDAKTNAEGIATAEWTLGASGEQEVLVTVKNLQEQLVIGAPLSFKANTGTIIGKWTAVSVLEAGREVFKNLQTYTRPSSNCNGTATIQSRVDVFNIEFKADGLYNYSENGYFKYSNPCAPPSESNPVYAVSGAGKFTIISKDQIKMSDGMDGEDDDFSFVKVSFNSSGNLVLTFLDENSRPTDVYTLKRI